MIAVIIFGRLFFACGIDEFDEADYDPQSNKDTEDDGDVDKCNQPRISS